MSFLLHFTFDHSSDTLFLAPASTEQLLTLKNFSKQGCLKLLEKTLLSIEAAVIQSGIRRCSLPEGDSNYPTESLTSFWSIAQGVFYTQQLAREHLPSISSETSYPLIKTCLENIRHYLNISAEEAELSHPSRRLTIPSISESGAVKHSIEDSDPDEGPSRQTITRKIIAQPPAKKARVSSPHTPAIVPLSTPRPLFIQKQSTCYCISVAKNPKNHHCTVSVKDLPGHLSDFKNSIHQMVGVLKHCQSINFHISPPELPYSGIIENNPKIICQTIYAAICRNAFFAQKFPKNKSEMVQECAQKGLNIVNRHYYSLLEGPEEADNDNHHQDLAHFVPSTANSPQPITIPPELGFTWWTLRLDPKNSKTYILSKKTRLYSLARKITPELAKQAANLADDFLSIQETVKKENLINISYPQEVLEEDPNVKDFINKNLTETETNALITMLISLNQYHLCKWYKLKATPYGLVTEEIFLHTLEHLKRGLPPHSHRIEPIELHVSEEEIIVDSSSEPDSDIEAIRPLYP